jgi:FkbM family methyltransferase
VRARLRQPRLLLARLFGPTEVDCRLFDGSQLRVVLPEIVAADLYLHGAIEPPVTQLLLERLDDGMVFVDVGAQYGYFSLLASRLVGRNGRVIAFEPARDTARLLRQNVAHLDNVVVEETAVAARTGTMPLRDYGARHSALNTVLSTARAPAAERRRLVARSYEVAAVSLDDYLAARYLRPDIIKLDAEGAEFAILQGACVTLRDLRPIIVLETGDYDGMASPSTSQSIELLEDASYTACEYDHGLRRHERRPSYGYGNLVFAPDARSRPAE